MQVKDLQTLVMNVLTERFPHTKIDYVAVKPDVDSDGDSVLRITVVIEDAQGRLDRDALVGFVRHLRSRLAVEDREEFPLLSFVSKNEAKKLNLESL